MKQYCLKYDVIIIKCMNKQLQVLIKILKEIKRDTYKETMSWVNPKKKKKFTNLLISFPLLVFYLFIFASFFFFNEGNVVPSMLDAFQCPKSLFNMAMHVKEQIYWTSWTDCAFNIGPPVLGQLSQSPIVAAKSLPKPQTPNRSTMHASVETSESQTHR